LKTGWVKTGRSVQEANKSKKERGRESEVRTGRQAGSEQAGQEYTLITLENLARKHKTIWKRTSGSEGT